MLSIGLTGGIGSGKSTVASIFEILDIPVLYTDDVAKMLMSKDPQLKKSIQNEFGNNAYIGNELNKSFLANIVFHDPVKLNKLNKLVHPVTKNFTQKWISEQKAPYVIKEAALLFESKSDAYTDYVIGVKAELKTRINRSIKGKNISKEQILKRIASQMDEKKKLSLCDFIVSNEENELIIPQVLKIHDQLINIIQY